MSRSKKMCVWRIEDEEMDAVEVCAYTASDAAFEFAKNNYYGSPRVRVLRPPFGSQIDTIFLVGAERRGVMDEGERISVRYVRDVE